MSKIEVNQISSQCGSTLTIGQSGDTVTLACGATQTGFGRTGTVNWDTTAKTASFTAVSGTGYFVNTTSGAITVTMPATPSAGDIVGIKDYAGTFATNNVTVGRNGSNFDGEATDPVLSTDQLSVFFVYVDGTQGWKATQSDSAEYGAAFVTATGGTITTCGDYKIHTFTGPGTFCVSNAGNPAGSSTVDYLVIAGGGAGMTKNARNCNSSQRYAGGGGGAGGLRASSGTASGCYTAGPLAACVSALPVTAQGYPITVGAGGPAPSVPATDSTGPNGSNSIFSTIIAHGGGGGGYGSPCTYSTPGDPGGSGGGGGAGPPSEAGGNGNTPPVSPPQGNNGGSACSQADTQGGGGGGATAAGAAGVGSPSPRNSNGGAGGAGMTSCITASPVTYAGGGGGGAGYPGCGGGSVTPGVGGAGGGGDGGGPPSNPVRSTSCGEAGTVNTGGGGGGAGGTGATGTCVGGNGGSGIVIIRYKYQ
jgi:hypothetical protein